MRKKRRKKKKEEEREVISALGATVLALGGFTPAEPDPTRTGPFRENNLYRDFFYKVYVRAFALQIPNSGLTILWVPNLSTENVSKHFMWSFVGTGSCI